MVNRALYPGSFDPITNGHLDILHRAQKLFDEVVILVAGSETKSPIFSPEERVQTLHEVVDGVEGVRVDRWDGLTMEYAQKHQIRAVIRGLRAASDFEYEFMMASMNKRISREVETVFMMTSQDLYFVSSTMIKGLYRYGGDISPYVPRPVLDRLQKKFS